MGDPVELHIAKRSVNEDALEVIKGTLARVEAGEVIGVGIVEVRIAGDIATFTSKNNCYHALLSGACRLMTRLASQND